MTPDLILRGGRVIDPAQNVDRVTDVAFADGVVAAVGDNLEADIHGARQMGIQPIWMTYVQSQKALEALRPADPQPPATPGVLTITNWQDFLTLLARA